MRKILLVLAVLTLALLATQAILAQCGGDCGGGCGGKCEVEKVEPEDDNACDTCAGGAGCKGMKSMDTKAGETFYQASGCGMFYTAEDAKKTDYFCNMCKQRILPTQKTADGTVSFATTPWPSKAGKDRVEVLLRDGDRSAVRGAKVTVTLCYTGKQPQNPLTLKLGKDGVYGLDYKLPAAGKWTATVAVTKNGKTTTYKFNFDVA